MESDSRLSPEPFILETKSEMPQDNRSMGNRFEAVVKKKFILGSDSSSIARRHRAEGKAEYVTKLAGYKQAELNLGQVYIKLRAQLALLREAEDFLASMSPAVINLAAASRSGMVNGFTATRWQLFMSGVDAEKEQLMHAIAYLQRIMNSESGLATTHASLSLKPIDIELPPFNPNLLPSHQASQYLKEAISEQKDQLGASLEIEAGIGVAVAKQESERAFLIEVNIPLGSKIAAASEMRVLQKEIEIVQAESELDAMRANQQFQILSLAIDTSKSSLEVCNKRISALTSLLLRARRAVNAGQSDVSEVLEIGKELYEVKKKSVELKEALEGAVLEAKFVLTGEVL